MKKFFTWIDEQIAEHGPGILEAAKEPLRILVLALIPFGLAYLEVISAEWATIATLFLRFLDKFLHNLAPEGEARGLTRF